RPRGSLRQGRDASSSRRCLSCSGHGSRDLDRSWSTLRSRCEMQGVGTNDRDLDRKSTRLNSSHVSISYAVFCLKTKKLTVSISDTAVLSSSSSCACYPRSLLSFPTRRSSDLDREDRCGRGEMLHLHEDAFHVVDTAREISIVRGPR